MGTRKHFTSEFKHEAVQLLESGSRPGAEIAPLSATPRQAWRGFQHESEGELL